MARVEVFARTETGCARERNEDAFLVLSLASRRAGQLPEQRVAELAPPGVILAVCDGMGGAAAGDVASQLATRALEEVALRAGSVHDPQQAASVLVEGVQAANRAILQHITQHPRSRGMGTTMTAAALFGPTAVLAHVGDSRGYVLRGRSMTQVTSDHSVVGQLVASGELTPEQARTYDKRNVLLQAVGVQPSVRPEVVEVDLLAGDQLILCSDGLTGVVEDGRIADLVTRMNDPMRAARALTEAACTQGAPDNVTVVVARFVGQGLVVPSGRTPVQLRKRDVMA